METNSTLPAAHAKLAAICAAKVAQYPQYAPERYYGWTPMVATAKITNRGAVVANKGDLLLASPEVRDLAWQNPDCITVVSADYPHEVSVRLSKVALVETVLRHVDGLVVFA